MWVLYFFTVNKFHVGIQLMGNLLSKFFLGGGMRKELLRN